MAEASNVRLIGKNQRQPHHRRTRRPLLFMAFLAGGLMMWYSSLEVAVTRWSGYTVSTVVSTERVLVDPAVGYLVKTESCILPSYDPWSETIKPYLKKPIKVNCNPTKMAPLTNATLNTIKITDNSSELKQYGVTTETISCCYQEITRVAESWVNYTKQSDNHYRLGECRPINISIEETVNAEAIYVKCSDVNKNVQVYQNVHYFFPKFKVEGKVKLSKNIKEQQTYEMPLNFYMIGIDSTSRQNLRRYMPNTFNFMSADEDSIDLTGYNKVADNTDPNISTLLMGEDPKLFISFKLECYKRRSQTLDKCPFIWKQFSAKGYATVYAEDYPDIGLFHFNKIGFRESPTDYYHRPFSLLSQHMFGKGKSRKEQIRCQGIDRSCEVILRNALKSMESLSDDVPIYGYFYSTSMTHDLNEGAAVLDIPYFNFFNEFIKRGYNNNTIILFYSDHGMRFGNIRSSHLGRLEERLPFMMMKFPPWFKHRFPDTWANLQINQHRLVTNYDVHLTIQDIINGTFEKSSNPQTKSGLGQSLFLEASVTRTCKSAGIPEHFCTCQSSHQVSIKDKDVKFAALKFVNYINRDVISKYKSCAKLSLEKVLSAESNSLELNQEKKNSKKTTFKKTGMWKTYTLMFQTMPGGARFEGTVFQEGTKWRVSEQFSRINRYGNQSRCVDSEILKKVCYCI